MKLMNIIHDSVVDGEGLRTVLFFAGCPHRCKGCHNPQSWSEKHGTEVSLAQAFREIESNSLTNVTFSGGEPFAQAKEAYALARAVKALGKSLWVYTGYTLDELILRNRTDELELLKQCDMLVDGPFLLEMRDLALRFRGSRNQRLLDREQIDYYLKSRSG